MIRRRVEISRLPRVVRFGPFVEICHMRDEPLKEAAASHSISLSAANWRLMRANRALYKSLTHSKRPDGKHGKIGQTQHPVRSGKRPAHA